MAKRTFVPMEAIGEDWTLDVSRSRSVGEVLTGYSYFEDGDIAFAKVTPCFENGKAAIMRGLTAGQGFGTTELTVVRPRHAVSAEFLFYVLNEDRFKQLGVAEMTGAGGLKRVPDRVVRDFEVDLPTRAEQDVIVSFLDRETAEIDAFIADQEELIGLLTERRAATITHAVTKGLRPSAPMKDSGVEWLGEVPASWAVGPMSRWCTVTLGKMLDAGKPAPAGSEPRPYLRAANIRPGWISLNSVYEMPMRPAEVSNLNLLAGDLLVVEGGATVGTNAVVRDDMPGWTYQKTINRVRSARGPSTRFIGYYLDVLRLRGVIEMISAASTFQHLTAEKLGALTLAAPSATESVTIADYLDHETAELDAAVADAREAIALSKERRAALISAAVTGKIDVRGLA